MVTTHEVTVQMRGGAVRSQNDLEEDELAESVDWCMLSRSQVERSYRRWKEHGEQKEERM